MSGFFPAVLSMHEEQAAARRLQRAIDVLHRTDVKPEVQLAEILTEQEHSQFVSLLGEFSGDVRKAEDVLKSALADLQALPTVSFELAFEPSHSFVLELKRWLVKHGPEQCRLAWRHTPQVVGGVRIEWSGKQHDYSLATKLETYDKFPEVS